MQRWLLLLIIVFSFTAKIYAQNSRSDSCIIATKAKHNSGFAPTSQTFCIGENIKIKLNNNQVIQGKIERVSNTFMVDGNEIDSKNIKWIKKTKATTGNLIGFAVMTSAGFALLLSAPGQTQSIADDELIGTALFFTGGAVLLTSRTKFRINKGDVLKFSPNQ